MVDITGDGIPDAIGYDTTGDGVIDSLDTNGNGRIDTAVVVMMPPDSHLDSPDTTKHATKNRSDVDDDVMSRLCGHNDSGTPGSRSRTPHAHAASPSHSHCCALQQPVSDGADNIWNAIDPKGADSISKLELWMAVQHNDVVRQFILPGTDCSRITDNQEAFDSVDAVFEAIGRGKHRINKADFAAFLHEAKQGISAADADMMSIFKAIDANGNGSVSKLEFLNALQRDPKIADAFLPGVDTSLTSNTVQLFDTINDIFDDIAGGKKNFEYGELISYFHRSQSGRPSHHDEDRGTQRVLIIGPGFGLELNPRQGDMVMRAGSIL
jgi:hypothetical protein